MKSIAIVVLVAILTISSNAFVFAMGSDVSQLNTKGTETVQGYSYGARSCKYILEYSDREMVLETIKIWMGGYLSGVSVLLDNKHFNMDLVDFDEFFEETISYCKNNPSSSFINSASNVIVKYIND